MGIWDVRDVTMKRVKEGKAILIEATKDKDVAFGYMTKQQCCDYIMRGYTVRRVQEGK